LATSACVARLAHYASRTTPYVSGLGLAAMVLNSERSQLWLLTTMSGKTLT
jgi:hypothetical protein